MLFEETARDGVGRARLRGGERRAIDEEVFQRARFVGGRTQVRGVARIEARAKLINRSRARLERGVPGRRARRIERGFGLQRVIHELGLISEANIVVGQRA